MTDLGYICDWPHEEKLRYGTVTLVGDIEIFNEDVTVP